MGAVTIKHVATAANVSVATVSRVLAGLDGVSAHARNRVLQVARQLNYRPNRIARSLRSGRRKVVGVVIPDLQNPFFTGVVHGIEAVLYGAGYTLLLGHSDGLAERELKQIEVLNEEGAAGLILIPGSADTGSYRALRAAGIPMVAVDREPKGLEADIVVTDNREGARTAVLHLASLGYKRIGLINGPSAFSVAQERQAGYSEALTASGISPDTALIVESDFRQAGGKAAMARLLRQVTPPRALLIANNLMTLGALEAIHDADVNIPADIALVSFDDMPWASSLSPPITCVAQPTEEMGRAAAELLLQRLRHPERVPHKVTLPCQLKIRQSCGTPRAAVSVPPTRAQLEASA